MWKHETLQLLLQYFIRSADFTPGILKSGFNNEFVYEVG